MSPNVNDLKDSRFLTKHDVEPEVLVTIKSYKEMNVAMGSQAPDIKWTLGFHELPKPLVLNTTNGQMIAVIMHTVHGVTKDESEDEGGKLCPGNAQFKNWIGKTVILFNDKTVSFGTEITGGIRVKAPNVRHQTEPDAPEEDYKTADGEPNF